jgi:sugar lactone lactonase YvrE
MEQIKPYLFADGFMFLEAPKWHDGRLWVSDVFDHKVCALSYAFRIEAWVEVVC